MQVLYSSTFKKATSFLNKCISHEDYGFKWKTGPVHCNRKTDILAYKQGERRWLRKINRGMFARHFSGGDTFYFTGAEYAEQTLVMLDIDCHGKGTPEGALAFSEFLRDRLFPNLYYEPSTNGRGGHGYILLHKKGKTAFEVNEFLRKLEAYLQQFQHRFDVELIELKGHCRELVFDGRRLVDVKCGQLAKVPRQMVERFDEFENTAVVDIQTFAFPSMAEARAVGRKVCGSSSGKHVGDWKRLLGVAKTIMGGRERTEVAKLVVTAEDLAVLLAILAHCTHDPNDDGSMPTARIRALWQAMFEAGDTERQFHAQRYKACRDLIDQHDGIDWASSVYTFGVACKWKLTAKLLEALDSLLLNEEPTHTSFVLDRFPLCLDWKPAGQVTRPEPAWAMPRQLPSLEEVEEFFLRRAA